MGGRVRGMRTWEGERDNKGFRTYKAMFLIERDSALDGPFTVMQTPGVPIVGAFWAYGNDIDPWCWCKPEIKCENLQRKPGHRSRFWHSTYTFSTEPLNRCQDYKAENPLLEPPEISGTYNNRTEQGTFDRFGEPIATSSFEKITTQQNEWDASTATIRIKQNVASAYLGYILPYAMMHHVNAFPMWGLPPRCIKLSSAPFSIKYYGSCSIYYERTLEFEIDGRTFDRDLLDEATKALSGRWNEDTGEWELIPIEGWTETPNPDPTNPSHYKRFRDRDNQACTIILDGAGKPYVKGKPLVQSCDVCPDGMSRIWRLSGLVAPQGFVIDPNDVNNPARYNGVLLSHTGDCTWQGTVGEGLTLGTVTLTLDRHGGIGLPTWTLTISTMNEVWTKESDVWDCTGPNTLETGGVIVVDNDRVTISPTASSEPGTIHVEKYHEANLFALGIPITF